MATWGKRIGCFLLVNFLVIITISFVLRILGVEPYLSSHGLNYQALLIFCVVWGMGGSFISLMLSKTMAKWMMGVRIVDPDTPDPALRQFVKVIHELAAKAGLPAMPEVGIYNSPEVNAFATGPSRSNSLVAVSSGLLQRMNSDEVEGVLAHEVAHIANGDMVTMTLVQGVINAFVMFLARALAFLIARSGRDERDGGGISYFSYYITVFVLEMFFMVLGSIVVAWFSRRREFRADAGGAYLAGKEKMVAALERLQKTYEIRDQRSENAAFQSFKISGRSSFLRFFATHPPFELRIERLMKAK